MSATALTATATATATVSHQLFAEALAEAWSVTEKRSAIPLLRTVLLKLERDQFYLVATDLEVFLQRRIPAELSGLGTESAAVALPCKQLISWLQALDGYAISITFDPENATAVFAAGNGQTATVPGISAESFPAFPWQWELETATVGAHSLQRVAQNVRTAITYEESRFTLNGALLIFEPGKLTGVATDGHRLAVQEVAANCGETKRALVPTRAINLLAAKPTDAGQCEISFSENWVRFSFGDREIMARLMHGKFPDYGRVLPESYPHEIEIDSAGWMGAVSRVAVFTDEQNLCVRLLIGHGEIRFETGDGINGKATEILAADYEAPRMEIGVNSRYLLNALEGALPGSKFCFSESDKPMEIRDEDGYRCVVMPMRI